MVDDAHASTPPHVRLSDYFRPKLRHCAVYLYPVLKGSPFSELPNFLQIPFRSRGVSALYPH
jgi:hypothetical protein